MATKKIQTHKMLVKSLSKNSNIFASALRAGGGTSPSRTHPLQLLCSRVVIPPFSKILKSFLANVAIGLTSLKVEAPALHSLCHSHNEYSFSQHTSNVLSEVCHQTQLSTVQALLHHFHFIPSLHHHQIPLYGPDVNFPVTSSCSCSNR